MLIDGPDQVLWLLFDFFPDSSDSEEVDTEQGLFSVASGRNSRWTIATVVVVTAVPKY
jgi:hypothetical protein